MPIKGISDIRRITRAGYLRLGTIAESKKGTEYPVKSDHFIPDFENETLLEAFHQNYGDEAKRVAIAFPSNDPDNFFSQWYKSYGKGAGMKCKGDGDTAWRVTPEGDLEEVPCPTPDECPFAKQHGCKRLASLQFFIKGIPGLQIVQINTTSFNSIVNLNTGIDMLRMLRNGKTIAGVWVDLVLVPQEAQADGKKVNIFVMKLDIPVSLDQAQQLTSAFEAPSLLPPPAEERDVYLQPYVEETRALPAPAPVAPAPKPTPAADPHAAARRTQYERWLALEAQYNLDTAYLKLCLSNYEIPEFKTAHPDDLRKMLDDIEGMCAAGAEPEPEPEPEHEPAPRAAAPRANGGARRANGGHQTATATVAASGDDLDF